MSGTVMQIVRVAILADSRLTEMALPAELPLREILPAVQRLVVPSAQNGDGGQADSGAAVQLSLAPVGGQPFSLDASLDTVGVVDGDLLVLQPVPAGPAAPGIVEDIADAAMIFSTSRLKPWGIAHIQRGALAAVIAVALLATGLTVTYRVATGVLAGLLAVAGIAVASALAGLLITIRSPRSGIALSIAALVPIGAALVLAVPGKFGPAQVLLGAAGVAAWSLIALMIPSAERERVVAFFTAAAVVGASVALAAGAQLLWQLPLLSIGCGLIVAALLVTIQAAQLSALWARFPLPVIPAPGIPPRRPRRCACWRICLGGCGSVTPIKAASSPRPCCSACWGRWPSRCAQRRSALWAGIWWRRLRPRPPCARGCGIRPHARRGCWLSPIW